MKVKRLREDFVVDEVSDFPLAGGPHAVYSLSKSGLGTPEAIQLILKDWNLSRRQIGCGGLKDRHAITKQTITIFRGPPKDLEQRGFKLEYLGQALREFGAKDILGNQFQITVRGLSSQRAMELKAATQSVHRGVPNYFDDQRFGSLGESGQFVGQPWCLGDYERALYLAIAEPNSHDRPREAEQKDILRKYWGNWLEAKSRLDRSHRRSIVTYLCDHPTDFRRAMALVRSDLRSIYVAAFQSHLWNRVVGLWWQQQLPPEQLKMVPGAAGALVFPVSLTTELAITARKLTIPLPSARQHAWPSGIGELLDNVLTEFALDRHQIRLKYPRDTFFSKGDRQIMLVPHNLQAHIDNDETADQKGTQKVCLSFRLDRGQYATMLLKYLDSYGNLASLV